MGLFGKLFNKKTVAADYSSANGGIQHWYIKNNTDKELLDNSYSYVKNLNSDLLNDIIKNNKLYLVEVFTKLKNYPEQLLMSHSDYIFSKIPELLELVNSFGSRNSVYLNFQQDIILGGYRNKSLNSDVVVLDYYSYSKVLLCLIDEIVANLDFKINLNCVFSIYSTIEGIVEAANFEVINNCKNYNKLLTQAEISQRVFCEQARNYYLDNFKLGLDNDIPMDEHTFIHYLLAYDQAQSKEGRNRLVFDINYAHALTYSIVAKELGNIFYLKDKPQEYKIKITDCLDLFVFYYSNLYNIDIHPVTRSTSSVAHSGTTFKNCPPLGLYYSSGTYSNSFWKDDYLFKIQNNLYSLSFFLLIDKIFVEQSYLLNNYKISKSTFLLIEKSLNYYINKDLIDSNKRDFYLNVFFNLILAV